MIKLEVKIELFLRCLFIIKLEFVQVFLFFLSFLLIVFRHACVEALPFKQLLDEAGTLLETELTRSPVTTF